MEFIDDLRQPLADRVHLTTDGYRPYLEAVKGAFGEDVDYAQLVKIHGEAPEGTRRYSPPECVGPRKRRAAGNPDMADVSTSYVERQNLTMRMSMRLFTRLANEFSKKYENHVHALALYFYHYNFSRIHKSLRVTPAMEAKLTDRIWSFDNLLEKVDEMAPPSAKRGPYKKRRNKIEHSEKTHEAARNSN